jgi:hypothetical protein
LLTDVCTGLRVPTNTRPTTAAALQKVTTQSVSLEAANQTPELSQNSSLKILAGNSLWKATKTEGMLTL